MSIEDEIDEVVRAHGWFGANVFDGEPPFFYTIGLMKTFDHPELIVFGLEVRDAKYLLATLVQYLRDGDRFDRNEIRSIQIGETDHRIGLRKVDATKLPLYFGYAMGYCRHMGRIGQLEAMQIFWPDARNVFPFETGFASELSDLQPRLDFPLTPREVAEFERQFE
jgi:hypothetical protein